MKNGRRLLTLTQRRGMAEMENQLGEGGYDGVRVVTTTDTGELAPHPDMTSDDLRDFEAWADEVDRLQPSMWPLGLGLAFCALVWWLV